MHDPTHDTEDTQAGRYLTFQVGAEDFGIGIAWIMEIVSMQKITPIPQMPAYVRGVINLRGKVIPVVDARRRFGLEDRAFDARTCIIVTQVDNRLTGIIVDNVREVQDIPQANIQTTEQMSAVRSDYIEGMAKVGEEVKILLNIGKLLNIDLELKAPVAEESVPEAPTFSKVA
jgi:purine-binding chemotaxis protein CheW